MTQSHGRAAKRRRKDLSAGKAYIRQLAPEGRAKLNTREIDKIQIEYERLLETWLHQK